jgi:N-acetylglucosaminyldiphosphoundecaprenol N-acetyl-beta-D-mannosaminyltransferase
VPSGSAGLSSGGLSPSAAAQVGLEGYRYSDHLARVSGAAALPSIALRGVRLHAVTEVQAVQHVLDQLGAGKGGWVLTPNLDHLRRLGRDRVFRALYTHANLVVADGMPLIWASRLQGTPLPERVAGSSLISSLSAGAAKANRSIYLLGGDPGTADHAAATLLSRNPNLTIAGTHCPDVGFEKDEKQLAAVIQRLVEARPDIIFVALGSPKQEWLIGQLRGYLPKAWWLGIGISFSFLSGQVRRAPRWMQRVGLEWLHRLCQEPRRLGRRYLLEGIPFGTSLLASSLAQGIGRNEQSLAAQADRSV